LVDFKRIFVQVADDVHGDDNARKCDNNWNSENSYLRCFSLLILWRAH
jgi:hypothetical protein